MEGVETKITLVKSAEVRVCTMTLYAENVLEHCVRVLEYSSFIYWEE